MISCCKTFSFTLITLWLAAIASAARAQAQVRVASLSEVRGLTSGDACNAMPTPGQRSSLSRLRDGRTEPAWPSENVVANDRLTVQPLADVRVAVDRPFGRGTIYLTPDLGKCASAERALKARGLPTPTGAARYRFTTDSARGDPNRLVLTVEHGSTVVEWNSGQLIVYAGARRLEVKGTRFAVIVDATTGIAALYVLEGVVAMVGQEGLTASQGETLVIRPNGAARVVTPDAALANDIQHKSRTVWGISDSRGGAWNSMRWVLGGALVGGTVYYITQRNGDDVVTTIPARITFRIPF